jgi:hypothetical protein
MCTLWSKNQWKPHKMSSTRILWQSGRFPKNCPECRKPCAIAHENRRKRTFSEKIKFELVWPKDLPWWCYALNYGRYMVQGPLVTKCVILASIWASNCLLGKITKRPVKCLERGPYDPKINGNLIKCRLQGFCDNPGGFQKIGPSAENHML